MIFETIRYVRQEGGRVAIVSPRIDVCRELFRGFSKHFHKRKACSFMENQKSLIATQTSLLPPPISYCILSELSTDRGG